MAEFDDKLNALLSNPDAMSQIMQLANSLSGDSDTAPAPAAPDPPPSRAGGSVLSSLSGGTELLGKLLPLVPLVYHVALIVSLMPASCTSVLIVRKYGGCPDFAGQSVFFSTIACIVTVPVFLYFLM